MRDLEFWNIPLRGRGLGSLLLSPFRRAARKIMLPFFRREVEILNDLARRLDYGDYIDESLREETKKPDPTVYSVAHTVSCLNIKYDNINVKFDQLNLKFDQLNVKFDQLNVKMESLVGKFGELHAREDTTREEFTALVAMHWDHVALGRRLAQLEDRMIAESTTAENRDDASILFPGLERYKRPQAG